MTRVRRLALIVLAAGVIAVLLALVGPRRVFAELSRADPRWLAVAAAGGLCSLGCWSEAQRAIHRGAGTRVSPLRFLRGYAAGVLAKQALPASGASGPAVTAYTLGRETGLAYDQDLSAVVVGRLLGTLTAVVPVAAGLGLYAVPGSAARSALVALAVAVLLVGGAVVLVAVRPSLPAAGARRLARAGRVSVGRVSASAREALAPERVECVIARNRRTLGAVGRDRRALAVAAAWTVAGWVAFAVPLWAGGAALGHPVPFALALFAVPAASLGTLVPLPSGAGGVDLVLGGLLAGIAGLSVPAAAAVVVVYRVCADLLPAVVGAVAVVAR